MPLLNFYVSNMSQPYPLLNKDFKEFVQFLNANAFEYLVVGGYALMAHGHPRYTGDIDFWVEPTRANIANLLMALGQFGFPSIDLKEEDFLVEQAVIQLGFPPARIDLMVAVSGVEFASAYKSRLKVDLDGTQNNVISRYDFIRNKKATGRPKDFIDLKELGVDIGRPDNSE